MDEERETEEEGIGLVEGWKGKEAGISLGREKGEDECKQRWAISLPCMFLSGPHLSYPNNEVKISLAI